MSNWRNFTIEQTEAISQEFSLSESGTDAVACPSCGQVTVHWYSYPNPNPWRSPSYFTYVWCSACRHYHGQTVVIPDWNLTDPLKRLSEEERDALESDFERFFHTLDKLWLSGELPQSKA